MTDEEKEHDRFLMRGVTCDDKIERSKEVTKILNDKVHEYVEKFHESVPVFMMPTMTAEELISVIDESLRSGKPIEVEPYDGNKIF